MPVQIAPAPSLETESDILPQEPPPFVVRAATQLLIAIFCIGLAAAIFVPLPETVECPFVLVPKDGADPIQSPRVAVVHKLRVAEGETVREGKELFVLRSDEIRGLDTQLRSSQEDLRNREEDLAKADRAYGSQIEIKDAEIAQAESEVMFRKKHATTNLELVQRMESLSPPGRNLRRRTHPAAARRGGIGEESKRGRTHLAAGETGTAADGDRLFPAAERASGGD